MYRYMCIVTCVSLHVYIIIWLEKPLSGSWVLGRVPRRARAVSGVLCVWGGHWWGTRSGVSKGKTPYKAYL